MFLTTLAKSKKKTGGKKTFSFNIISLFAYAAAWLIVLLALVILIWADEGISLVVTIILFSIPLVLLAGFVGGWILSFGFKLIDGAEKSFDKNIVLTSTFLSVLALLSLIVFRKSTEGDVVGISLLFMGMHPSVIAFLLYGMW